MGVELRGIGVHPVKSTAIRPVERAEVRAWGLAGDRRWMVVDGDNTLVTARELHDLFRVVADTPDTDPGVAAPLRLSAEMRCRMPMPWILRRAAPNRALRMTSANVAQTPTILPTMMKPAISASGIRKTKIGTRDRRMLTCPGSGLICLALVHRA